MYSLVFCNLVGILVISNTSKSKKNTIWNILWLLISVLNTFFKILLHLNNPVGLFSFRFPVSATTAKYYKFTRCCTSLAGWQSSFLGRLSPSSHLQNPPLKPELGWGPQWTSRDSREWRCLIGSWCCLSLHRQGDKGSSR